MVLEVIVDISTAEIDRPFDYEGDDIPVGSRVAVPFGPRRKIGFVIGKKQTSEFPSLKRAEYIDTPVDEKQLELAAFMRKAYNLRYIDVLRLLVPAAAHAAAEIIEEYPEVVGVIEPGEHGGARLYADKKFLGKFGKLLAKLPQPHVHLAFAFLEVIGHFSPVPPVL